MASARPSTYRKSGGFLNNVDGVITDYEMTTTFPGTDSRARKPKKSDFNPLYFVLSARVDGAEEDVTTTLFMGSADDFEITDDGKTITPVADDIVLREGTSFDIFLKSMIVNGFDENKLPEDEINFEPIVNERVRFVQVVNEETTKRLGKRKSKDGKQEYNRTDLQVAAVYGAATKATRSTKTTTSPSKGVNVKAATKPNGKAVDLTDLADETLVAILTENDGSILRGKLAVKIAQKLGIKHPHREEVRKLVYSEAHLNDMVERGLITYDPTDKTQEISLT